MSSYLDLNGLQTWHQHLMDEINWCPIINVQSGTIDSSIGKIFNLNVSEDVVINISGQTKKEKDEIWITLANSNCQYYHIVWPSNVSFCNERIDTILYFRKLTFRLHTYDRGISWICENMLEAPCGNASRWSFNLLMYGNYLYGEIPFSLADMPSNSASMAIDWGDGTFDIRSLSDIENFQTATDEDFIPSHVYSEKRTYTITIESEYFDELYLNNGLSENFSDKLVKINSPLPKIAGINYLGTKTSNTFFHAFSDCIHLNSIPEKLFEHNSDVDNFSYCFSECKNLYHIPYNILSSCTSIQQMNYFIRGCTYLEDLELHIPSENISSIQSFFPDASVYAERNFNIYVPANSTSSESFNAITKYYDYNINVYDE